MAELFLTWLRKQSIRNDSIGDLARDYINDKNNDLITGYGSFCRYMEYMGACGAARGALARAYQEYKDSKRPQRPLSDVDW